MYIEAKYLGFRNIWDLDVDIYTLICGLTLNRHLEVQLMLFLLLIKIRGPRFSPSHYRKINLKRWHIVCRLYI